MLRLIAWPFRAVLSCFYFILVLWALIDLAGRRLQTWIKIMWVLVILLIPYLGVLAYAIVGRSADETT